MYEENEKQTKHLDIDHLSVAANTAYYIEKSKVYELDVENTKEPQLLKSLKDKQISRIVNGAKHFFAIEKGRKLTSEWDTKDLVEWAHHEGYEDYIKIFKS